MGENYPRDLTDVEREALTEVVAGHVKVRRTPLGGLFFSHTNGSGLGSILQVSRLYRDGLIRVTGGGRARLTVAGKRAMAEGRTWTGGRPTEL